MDHLSIFNEIWLFDFEFQQPPGECPRPLCLVARELVSGRLLRIWKDELDQLVFPPYSIGENSLFVAYYASAEFGCHLALGWPMPVRILDLYAEFRCLTSGLQTPNGRGLLGALSFYGQEAISAGEKESMRQLVMRGGHYSDSERKAVLDYCQSDVDALDRLLTAMSPGIDLPRALVRGRYTVAAAKMEANGIPIDTDALDLIRGHWEEIQLKLIQSIDQDYGVFEGRTFKMDRWSRWLRQNQIPWPRLQTGKLALDDQTFRTVAKSHPSVAPIRELRHALSQLRLQDLSVGQDGRNRCMLSVFGSKTGRNQPGNTKFVFGPAVWLRSLIRPHENKVLAYVDYSQQEFGIGAALSNDTAMQLAYISGDPYLQFAIQAGAAPPNATKLSHKNVRDQFKTCALGVQYGMSAESLAQKINESVPRGRELLDLHHRTYPDYWRWSDEILQC